MKQTYLSIPEPWPNVGTYLIDQVYTKCYKKYLHFCWFAQYIPKSFWVERNAKRTEFHKINLTSYPWLAKIHIKCDCNVELIWRQIDFTKPL
jgi:hypothetical protein